MSEYEVLASKVLAAVKEYVAVSLSGIASRVKATEEKLATLRDGKDGAIGLPGEKGEQGMDGARGLDGEKGIDGINGRDGKDGLPGKDGRDGEDFDPEEMRRMILEEVAKAIAELPPAKEGEPGRDGRDGKAGPPGRDATQIEFIDLEPARSYPRGTHACFAGGVLRAARTTDPFTNGDFEEAGWKVVWSGFKGGQIEVSEDSRDFNIEIEPTAGPPIAKRWHIPTQRYCGVWREGEYKHGDTVTWGGSNWHANRLTKAKPGIDQDWTLITKRGSDGRDAR